MKTTSLYILLAFLLGITTASLVYDIESSGDINKLQAMIQSIDSSVTMVDSSNGNTCACDDDQRYNIENKQFSGNYPVSRKDDAREMVRRAWQPDEHKIRGAWISKLTLDQIFCNDLTLNGIFVYEGFKDPDKKDEVYVVEGYRSDAVNTIADGTSTIYYADQMCPVDCGYCGN